jgi:hypothetical protein
VSPMGSLCRPLGSGTLRHELIAGQQKAMYRYE